ncbi:MAG: CPBP family intramembrane metalloprotease [Cyclobacteriaceae bacterium]
MLNSSSEEKNPWLSLLIIVLMAFGTAIVSPLIFSGLVSVLTGSDYNEVIRAFNQPDLYPELKVALLSIQLLTSFAAFVLVPLVYISHFEKRNFERYLQTDLDLAALFTTGLLVIAFMVVNSVFIEWNMNIKFPDGIDQIARELEEKGKILTDYFTAFDGPGYFVLAFIAIAIVPALGEELLFRGVIQRQILRITGNAHLAVWLAAIFFSAFHFQFFGFVPRMLLGALFGYLFIYSGNLVYPIFAHFVNNGFTLLMIYLHQNEMVPFDIENTETVPLDTVLIFLIIGAGLFIYFYKQMNSADRESYG